MASLSAVSRVVRSDAPGLPAVLIIAQTAIGDAMNAPNIGTATSANGALDFASTESGRIPMITEHADM
jgi:hypothetical protein